MKKGIILDMDGTISDTQKLHSAVESEILGRYGVNLSPEEITEKYSGVRPSEFFHDLLNKTGKPYNLSALLREKWSKMEKYAKESVDEVPGARNLIDRVYMNNFRLSVDSSSQKDYCLAVLNKLNVLDYFIYVVAGDTMVEGRVIKGKPDPESFLLAASKMGLLPEECIVIGDGISDMEGAKRAGMYAIGLVKDKSKKYPTKNLVTSLYEINPDYINNLKE